MKLVGKRFWIFEAMMLLGGVLTACVEALNYGISLFYVIGHLIVFPLCFMNGGIVAWKVAKSSGVWRLVGYNLLFSAIIYNLFQLILYPVYGVPFSSFAYWEAAIYYILFAILPLILCCYAYKWIEKCWA